ncbi:AMP-binding protein [Streptomyces flavofungini]|uniref:AMP-binding protein n=1 Tax=Streptomyces flavofungini TaxID=68200 RepID=A0ABS0XCH9_9ACTN|nr:AMP-binding protein [Streptomyces flavofungini]MBJ3810649.1 AMP-binding protein [Streptomyces flavofungini]
MKDIFVSSAAAVHRQARVDGNSAALICENADVSFTQLSERVRYLASILVNGGLEVGERVAYFGLNSALLIETALAAAHAGAIFVPISSQLASDEVVFQLNDASVRAVVVEEEYVTSIDAIVELIPVRHYVTEGSASPASSSTIHSRWQRISAVLTGALGDVCDESLHVYPEDIAMLFYTSGTTGRPKGVALTHGNLWWNHLNVSAAIDVRPRATTLTVTPMCHIGGLGAFTLFTLVHGGTVVVRRHFDAERCLHDLVAHRVARMFAVPAIYAALAHEEKWDQIDLSSLTTAVVAGAPVPSQLIRDYLHRGIRLQQAWGMTETASFATYLPPQCVESTPESAGFPMPYTQIRIVDPQNGAVLTEPLVPGEICVRGPHVTQSYWKSPRATERAIDGSGWLHSGDIGYLDSRGLLYVVDRIKDVIFVAGENVYPAEVERVLVEMPGVREAAVVGVPHEVWGETPVAFLCKVHDSRVDIQDLREFAGLRLARFKLPTAVYCIDALPRNVSGKVDKATLRSWVLEGAQTS